ncbi:hypothetical protein [Desulfomonile tiedjei]|uniref:Uncharacterized protein n=1 Tax=Desulfomonile tiedjei (strain ATCC 49306 / DSM 6799 / DCB-1) TaxID=706587 RepID=I4C1J2_DESTA|nr:hypothetical protein [Desulfomonile tiedjei]AFM23433.1 hypothetical protein Desti_0707 [Desulfomonile tiedjei DSM 6799]
MRLTKVGMPFIPGVKSLPVGITYDYTPGGHTLTMCMADPTTDDILAVNKHEAVFGLLLRQSTLFVLSKFGHSPWKQSYYNWWINAPVMRPDPCTDLHRLEMNGGIVATVCLVNAGNGLLEAVRAVRLSLAFSREFLRAVCAQTKIPFDPWRHAEIVENVLDDFASGADVMKDVLCICSEIPGGFDRLEDRTSRGFAGSAFVGTA